MLHHFWLMKSSMKSRVAAEAIRKSGRGFIFCRTRAGVERVTDEVEEEGLRVTAIHGGMQQNKRERALTEFNDGNTHAIVATDVAARGLDIPGINCVIHYDPPENGKAFKHRSGRTARAGGSGTVISFVQNPQKGKWSKIQREVGLNVKFGPPEFNDLIQHEEISYIAPPPKRNHSRDRKDRRGRPNSGNDRKNNHYGGRSWKGGGGGGRGRGGGGGRGRGGGGGRGRGGGGGRGQGGGGGRNSGRSSNRGGRRN
jgi:superfamily II DNA/RNA helicase